MSGSIWGVTRLDLFALSLASGTRNESGACEGYYKDRGEREREMSKGGRERGSGRGGGLGVDGEEVKGAKKGDEKDGGKDGGKGNGKDEKVGVVEEKALWGDAATLGEDEESEAQRLAGGGMVRAVAGSFQRELGWQYHRRMQILVE